MANILGGEWEGGGSRGVIAPQLYELHPGVSVPCVPINHLALLRLCVLSLSGHLFRAECSERNTAARWPPATAALALRPREPAPARCTRPTRHGRRGRRPRRRMRRGDGIRARRRFSTELNWCGVLLIYEQHYELVYSHSLQSYRQHSARSVFAHAAFEQTPGCVSGRDVVVCLFTKMHQQAWIALSIAALLSRSVCCQRAVATAWRSMGRLGRPFGVSVLLGQRKHEPSVLS